MKSYSWLWCIYCLVGGLFLFLGGFGWALLVGLAALMTFAVLRTWRKLDEIKAELAALRQRSEDIQPMAEEGKAGKEEE